MINHLELMCLVVGQDVGRLEESTKVVFDRSNGRIRTLS